MFAKSDIRKVIIALEKIHSREVCLELGKAGIIHLSRSQDTVSDPGSEAVLKEERAKLREILTGVEYALNALGIEPDGAVIPDRLLETGPDEKIVSGARRTIDRVRRLRSGIQEEMRAITEHMACLDALSLLDVDPASIRKARLAKMAFGTVENTGWEVPANENFHVAGTGGYVFGAALPQDFPGMIRFLKGFGFTDKSEMLTGASIESLMRRQNTLTRRIGALDRCLDALRRGSGPVLVRLQGIYRTYEEVLNAVEMSLFSSRAMFMTGWMDIRDRQRLLAILQGICSGRFIAIVSGQRDADAPVRLMNLRLLRPFELLVKTFGMPANSEIDPTPLTAATFVLMFGLMFGDLGQGLILALVGMFLYRSAKKRGAAEGALGQAGGVLTACGLAAACCGMLYGSIFSNEHIMPALLFHPATHIMSLFAVTMMMGALFITVGLGVNVINSLMGSDYAEALLEKRGLAVLVPYVTTVCLAVSYARTGSHPAPWVAGVLIILPLSLFCLRGVLGPALFKARKPRNMAEYCIETIMDILEICITMLANTVSFIRVGAFALSHAGLGIVTYTLAGIADPALKSVAAVIVIIAGNIFIIGFEGLICGIQSMRLEYYEFFSKFFKGDGIAFTPFTLKAMTSEV